MTGIEKQTLDQTIEDLREIKEELEAEGDVSQVVLTRLETVAARLNRLTEGDVVEYE